MTGQRDSWDRSLGRRFYGLWYAGTVLFTAGFLVAAPYGVLLIIPAVVLWLLAQRTRRRATRISALANITDGPRITHPVVAARQHEPGTWWARWAWVDVALLVAIAVVMIVKRGG